MLIKESRLKGVFEISLEPLTDHRGFFMRVYDEVFFKNRTIDRNWVQENQSFSKEKGTVRGLHFQFPPHSEAKLVRAINGEVYDVILDLRKNSPTFGEWESFRLSSDNNKMIFIPRGFAHGVCSLSDNCTLLYKVDNYYAPESEGTVRWDDPDLGIDWPVDKCIVSEKDSRGRSFNDFIKIHSALEV
jgi:dTDP-4-dehydrorhamnose 3,5-epimerase